MLKTGLVVFMGVFHIGRRRGHQLGEEERSFASSSLASSSMNDQYLRGPSLNLLMHSFYLATIPAAAAPEINH